MKNIKSTIIALLLVISTFSIQAEGLVVGDKPIDFKLNNINGKKVSLSDYKKDKGVVLIFTCNHCPFSKAYEERIVALDKKYKKQGFPVVAINPNDAINYPDDNFENMKIRAKDKGFTFPYLVDETQEIAKRYGAIKTPHVYLVDNKTQSIAYIGAIDDNSESASEVKEKYLENAIEALKSGKKPEPSSTKAIGCGIKWKK